MGYGGEYRQKYLHTRLDIECVPFAIHVDRLTVDELDDDVGLSRIEHAGVEQACNVRVGQLTEQTAFGAKTPLADPIGPPQEFDGDRAFEAAIGAVGSPDTLQATVPDFGVVDIRPHPSSDQK